MSPRLLAFVGQNEAGKSSLLSALNWSTELGTTPLARADGSRANATASGWVVGVRFALDEADLSTLTSLGLSRLPSRFNVWKQADGRLHAVLPEGEDKRDPAPFERAEVTLRSAINSGDLPWDDVSEEQVTRTRAEALLDRLSEPDEPWGDSELALLGSLVEWLDIQSPGSAVSADLQLVHSLAGSRHPKELAVERLLDRMPRFALFGEQYRDLPTRTNFDARGRLQAVAPSIQNLLDIAGITVREIENARGNDDSGAMDTLTTNGNKRLAQFFGKAWNQSGIAVKFVIKESFLECLITDSRTGESTSIEERSDGLRAFVTLVAFVESRHEEVPPILLIDEAETHLHLDAQADLVSVLLGQLPVTQVIYTTHSPGCLPSDLGTGIRLVARDQKLPDRSELRSDFWTNTGPGLSPLLFAMGAGAAAFSACRRAVLAEGSSEMIMLPTLLRQASGVKDLGYQIVPGLSQASIERDDLDSVAAKVLYLLDGDKSGREKRDALLARPGVDEGRVFLLHDEYEWALEDLLDADYVLRLMRELRSSNPPLPDAATLAGPGTLFSRLQRWAIEQDPPVKLAGKNALAYKVIGDADRAMHPEATEVLASLHSRLSAAFQPPGAPKRRRK